ncbi:helix-turn-helix domain-containing protein [Pseudoclavibacter endophyticus]|uniref:Helix-turn-helix domain-containing protein n=2 Tax=Pseudoclavibacter endophyticus TaxID=1778590 RepID=A0A6H9WVD2_9MICO|nr:helix-turn-helix domain-containing protein [Pseudoclavibacter endophyticus]
MPDRPPGPGEGPRFMTIEEVAEVLRVDGAAVLRLVASTELLAIRVGDGGPWRVEREQVEQFIDDRYDAQQRLARFREAASVDLPELFGPAIPEDS